MTAPAGTANVNAIQNDLKDSGEPPKAVKENVNAMSNDIPGETVLFRFEDGTLALLPESKCAEFSGKLVAKDDPKYKALSAAVQGNAPDGGNCNQDRGTFYRLDAPGNRVPVEV